MAAEENLITAFERCRAVGISRTGKRNENVYNQDDLSATCQQYQVRYKCYNVLANWNEDQLDNFFIC